MRAATSANQITYRTYCDFGGCRNSSLSKQHHERNGQYYTTYHFIGHGEMYWKQDLPAGPDVPGADDAAY